MFIKQRMPIIIPPAGLFNRAERRLIMRGKGHKVPRYCAFLDTVAKSRHLAQIQAAQSEAKNDKTE